MHVAMKHKGTKSLIINLYVRSILNARTPSIPVNNYIYSVDTTKKIHDLERLCIVNGAD